MQAAVVTSFDCPPRYQEFPVPVPAGEHEMLVDVLAAGLHPRVRSQADGSHYTSTGDLPLVPGIDGVGRGPDGLLRYFLLPDTRVGTMAERTVIDTRRSIVLPDTTDPVAVAAAMNPAMSSWVALRQRVSFQAGQDVLVLGATGSAGQLAVQIARLFGAGQVIAAALRAARLQIVGSGQGSVSPREYLAELPALAQAIASGALDVDARAVPLAQVEQAWAAGDASHRVVLVP